jgi:signal transduction histidine kinase
MEIAEEDRRLLRELAVVILPSLDEIISRWYEFLLTREETKALLSATLVEGHLKHMQKRYFRELLAAEHDESYFAGRTRIGLIHYRVGLAPEWYLGAYRKYWDIVQSVLAEQGFDKEKVIAWTRALQKVMHLDVALALDAYFDAYVKDLEDAKESAETANSAKSEFMAMVTHDLRNPLNSVIGFTDILRDEIDGPVNEAQRGSLRHIEKSARHILRLVDEILDFARVERTRTHLQGRITMQAAEFSLRGVVHETVASHPDGGGKEAAAGGAHPRGCSGPYRRRPRPAPADHHESRSQRGQVYGEG